MAIDDHALTTTEHSPVAGLAHDARGGISNVVLGMLLFITSEVMFFAGLFAAYFNVRANAPAWPPVNVETGEPFHLEILPLVGPATVLLILSSFTCQFAVWAIRRGDRTAFIRNIAVTFLIGVVFLGSFVRLERHHPASGMIAFCHILNDVQLLHLLESPVPEVEV